MLYIFVDQYGHAVAVRTTAGLLGHVRARDCNDQTIIFSLLSEKNIFSNSSLPSCTLSVCALEASSKIKKNSMKGFAARVTVYCDQYSLTDTQTLQQFVTTYLFR